MIDIPKLKIGDVIAVDDVFEDVWWGRGSTHLLGGHPYRVLDLAADGIALKPCASLAGVWSLGVAKVTAMGLLTIRTVHRNGEQIYPAPEPSVEEQIRAVFERAGWGTEWNGMISTLLANFKITPIKKEV